MRALCIVAAIALVCLRCPNDVRANDDLTIEPVDKSASVVGGEEVKFRYSVRTPDGLDGQIKWSLTVKERIVAQGQFLLTLAAARAAEAVVTVKTPEVKEGESLDAQLSVAVHPEGEQRIVAKHVRTIRIAPRNPLSGLTEAASSYFESLTAGDVEKANGLATAPFYFDGKEVVKTMDAVKEKHQAILKNKGKRKVPEYTVKTMTERSPLDQAVFPDHVTVRITIVGDNEHIDIYVVKGEVPKVIGFRD